VIYIWCVWCDTWSVFYVFAVIYIWSVWYWYMICLMWYMICFCSCLKEFKEIELNSSQLFQLIRIFSLLHSTWHLCVFMSTFMSVLRLYICVIFCVLISFMSTFMCCVLDIYVIFVFLSFLYFIFRHFCNDELPSSAMCSAVLYECLTREKPEMIQIYLSLYNLMESFDKVYVMYFMM